MSYQFLKPNHFDTIYEEVLKIAFQLKNP